MIDNADIQQAWVAKSKSSIAITALVTAREIREDQWKGTNFTYPNIRVKLLSLMPTTPSNTCQIFRSKVAFRVFVEPKSSRTADEIAGTIANEFWGRPFTSGGVKFTAINLESIVPADVPEEDMNSWMSEVIFDCLVQSA